MLATDDVLADTISDGEYTINVQVAVVHHTQPTVDATFLGKHGGFDKVMFARLIQRGVFDQFLLKPATQTLLHQLLQTTLLFLDDWSNTWGGFWHFDKNVSLGKVPVGYDAAVRQELTPVLQRLPVDWWAFEWQLETKPYPHANLWGAGLLTVGWGVNGSKHHFELQWSREFFLPQEYAEELARQVAAHILGNANDLDGKRASV